ncbi:MAG TPA: hypothetical protein VKB80_34940 [Kofleriaceae bacterium]|nr:hypothetical protein [Kofleriaceae bacterium]
MVPAWLRSATAAAALAATAAVAITGAGCAGAQRGGEEQAPAVVVLEVRGAQDARWQERVEELATARRIDVIPADRYWVMARRLRAEPLTARNVARVAASLGASAVVHGRLSGKKRHQVVTIYVRDGHSGRVVEKHRVRLGRGRPAARSEAALERRLLASVAPTPPEPALRARPASPPAPAPAAAAEPPAREEPAPPRTARASAAATPPTARPEPGPPAPPPPVKYDERGQAIDDETPTTLK